MKFLSSAYAVTECVADASDVARDGLGGSVLTTQMPSVPSSQATSKTHPTATSLLAGDAGAPPPPTASTSATTPPLVEWTLYGSKLDLTHFKKTHPGGDLALILGAGRDCTELFEQYHLRPPTKTLLKWGVTPPPRDAFHADLLAAAAALPNTKATTWHIFVSTLTAAITLAAWVGWAHGSYVALFIVPVANWLLSVNVAHDAAHFAFSTSPLLNELLALLSCPLLFNTSHWYLQHNVSHHIYTNEPGKDLDLSHFMPFARLHAGTKWKPAFARNVAWVAFGFSFAALAESMFFPFFTKYKRKQLGEVKYVNARTRIGSAVQMSISLAVILLPYFWFSLPKAILFATVPFAITSFLFMSISQISHVQEVAQGATTKEEHWTRRQVKSSLDYSQDSHLVSYLTGGLNSQGLHHLLPFLSSSRFVDFYPTYRRICKKHDIQIHESKSFFHSYYSFWMHVGALSEPLVMH